MKYKLMQRLIFGIICVFLLVCVHAVSGELKVYPREEGSYTVFIGGKCYGGSLPFITWSPFKYPQYGIHFGPFCKYNYPHGPEYNWERGTIFIVNNEIIKLDFHQIGLYGLIGFCPAYGQWFLKFNLESRIRVFGVCEEIYIWYG